MADDKIDKTPESQQSPAGEASNVAPFAATGRGKPCPICGRPSIIEMRPFCSKRCADVDLNRWLGGIYRVPSTEPVVTDDESEQSEGAAEKP
jgi:endogenous inhibitor of DNA gyrase (YacG/DUF329 family)